MSKPLLTLTRKDFAIFYFSGRGAGGQHRNKHMNCVRITHLDSGCCAQGTESRSRERNKRRAFNRLTKLPKFKAWLHMQSLHAEDFARAVEEAMNPRNLKIEMMEDGKWKKI